jgi:hypothetical protein
MNHAETMRYPTSFEVADLSPRDHFSNAVDEYLHGHVPVATYPNHTSPIIHLSFPLSPSYNFFCLCLLPLFIRHFADSSSSFFSLSSIFSISPSLVVHLFAEFFYFQLVFFFFLPVPSTDLFTAPFMWHEASLLARDRIYSLIHGSLCDRSITAISFSIHQRLHALHEAFLFSVPFNSCKK